MKTKFDTIILSPHLDDAIFSLGGILQAQMVGKAKVINIYTQSRYTIHGLGERQEVTRTRLKEDASAMGRLGVTKEDWGFPDSTLKSIYPTEKSYLDPRVKLENDPSFFPLQDRIRRLVKTMGEDTLFFAPLGLGNHVEHRIVTAICLGIPALHDRLVLYEDGSYFEDGMGMAAQLASQQGRAIALTIKAGPFDWKAQLIKCYQSQVDDAIYEDLRVAFAHHRGEKLWTNAATKDRLESLFQATSTVKLTFNI